MPAVNTIELKSDTIFISLKTLSIVLSDPSCKDGNTRLNRSIPNDTLKSFV